MREGWMYKKLGEVCFIITKGTTPSSVGYEFLSEGINFIKIESISDTGRFYEDKFAYVSNECHNTLSRSQLECDDILFSIAGALGRTARVTKEVLPANTNQALAIIRLKDKTDVFIRLLLHQFKSKIIRQQIDDFKAGVAQLNLSLAQMKQLKVAIPPLTTQQQIVSELDLLSHILDQKRQQLKEYDALAESIFYDMFGDPNNSSFELTTISELSREKLTYGSTASAIPYDGEIRYLRITDILPDGSLSPEIMSPNVYDEKYILEVGDILFARSGATVGKTYCYKETDGKGIYAGYLIRMKPNKDKVLPLFIYYFTRTAYYKAFIESNSNAVAQPNVNAKQYGGLKLPLPPLTLQRSFAAKIESIEHQKQLLRASIKETEMLFQSRMDYWFNS